MNSVVTQYSKIASSRFTFEDLFFIKLYTFAQWVHCVRFCGQNIEDLGNLIQTPCVKCGLRSDQDSWYSRFNADTRCSGAKAKFWSVETCKLIDSLKKAERKETKFFRGFNIPMDEYDQPFLSPFINYIHSHLIQIIFPCGGCCQAR